MQQTDVAQAIATLQAQGKVVSHGNIRRLLGYGSLRDIVMYRNRLLPACDTTPAEPDSPPPTLAERPRGLCYLCRYAAWFEWSPNLWRCALCGTSPALR